MAWFSIPAALASRGRPGIIVALGMTVMLAGCAQTGENGPQGLLKGDPSVSGDRNDRGLLAEGSGDSRRNGSGDTVYFSSDSSDLTPEAQQTLQLQARWLAANAQRTITIEGHADERGTREYNLALGARRAGSVRDFLASQGLAASQVRTISYGKERPVAVCDDISCWSQNRRAQTVLNGGAIAQR
jgi:peptidoglycan-associated lipoprotein